jgi:FkbM family methyltransferase
MKPPPENPGRFNSNATELFQGSITMKIDSRLKRVLKTGQTWFPWSRSGKFETYNFLTRHFGKHVEPEFRLLAELPPIGLALDVGGNWGQSIEAMRYYGKPQRIVCFEPNPPLAKRLLRIYGGSPDVEIMPIGLGANDGLLPLHTPVYGEFVFDGATSFDREDAATFLNAERMAWFKPGRLRIISENIAVKHLDGLGLLPDVIKLDVQGFEHAVLLGGHSCIEKARPFTILENPTQDVVAFFAALAMKSYVLRGDTLYRSQISGHNTLFLTDECAAGLIASGKWKLVG